MSTAGKNSISSPFTACMVWFHCFKARYHLCKVKLVGEQSSADHNMAKIFTAEPRASLRRTVTCQSRCLMVMRPACFGKKMPTRMYISV